MRTLFLISVVAIAAGAGHAVAQTVHVGAVGGAAVTDPLQSQDESKRYLIGPSVELRVFGGRIGVEFDVIYRRTGTSFSYSLPPNLAYPQSPFFYSNRQRGNTWEFPLIGKYYFRDRNAPWRPFLGTGYLFRRTSWETTSVSYFSDKPTEPQIQKFKGLSGGVEVGATAVAGIEWKARGRLSFQPQFRYTRFSDRTSPLSRGQTDFLLGIRF